MDSELQRHPTYIASSQQLCHPKFFLPYFQIIQWVCLPSSGRSAPLNDDGFIQRASPVLSRISPVRLARLNLRPGVSHLTPWTMTRSIMETPQLLLVEVQREVKNFPQERALGRQANQCLITTLIMIEFVIEVCRCLHSALIGLPEQSSGNQRVVTDRDRGQYVAAEPSPGLGSGLRTSDRAGVVAASTLGQAAPVVSTRGNGTTVDRDRFVRQGSEQPTSVRPDGSFISVLH